MALAGPGDVVTTLSVRLVAPLIVVGLMGLMGCVDSPGAQGPAGEGCNNFLDAETAYPQPVVVLETTMGTIEAEICVDAVPITAQNFLDHVEDGVYDGTKFHRIIPGFMMQGGDPNSKDDDPSDDGQGGEGDPIRDEFHWKLRHEGKGVLSMANSGPNTGTSQFFITFDDATHLDDRHAIFGQVIRGMDVLDDVEELGTESGAPTGTVTLREATVRMPDPAEQEAAKMKAAFDLSSPDAEHRVPLEGGDTQFIVVAESRTNHRVNVRMGFSQEGAVNVGLEQAFIQFTLPAYQRVAFLMAARVEGEDPVSNTVRLNLTGDNATAQVDLTVERSGQVGPAIVEEGDTVRVHYIGMTIDGRIFDTSVARLARDAETPKYATFQLRSDYQPFSFTPGEGVIQGFTDLAVDTPEGGQSAARIPPEQAYGARGQSALAGRTLIFQLEVLEIEESGA